MRDSVIESVSEEMERQIRGIFAEHHLVGVSIGIVRDGELVWRRGLGYADLASGRRADEDTLYRVASITKTFTGTALFQLRDEGRLGLDDPIVRHIPEFAAVRARKGSVEGVTLRRMLCHHSGLVGESPGDHWETLKFPTVQELLAALPGVEIVLEQDSAFKYSNLAFALLGEVVSRVSGRPYTEYVRANLLEPLGMTSTTFELTDALRPRMATGYQIRPHEDAPSVAPHPPLNGKVAGGGLYSCVADLARWIALQLRTDAPRREGAQALAGRSLKEMQRPQFVEPGWNAGHCLPWRGQRIGQDIYLGHGGGLPGFLTQILFCPERRLGLIALTNADGHSANVLPRIIETLTKAEDERPQDVTLEKPAPTPKAWQEFVGVYVSGTLGARMSVECRKGELVLVAPPVAGRPMPAVRLEPTDEPDAFLETSGRGAGEVLRFRRDEDGKVTGYTTTGFPWRKLVNAGS